MQRGIPHRVAVAAAVCATAALAACSSSGSNTGGASATGSSTPAAGSSAPVAGSSAPVAANSTGPSPTGTPITLGFLVPDSGVEANPQVLPAEQRGLTYVNDTLGGINGRPLNFIVCHSDGTPAKAVSCANQFVQDKVVAVIDGFDRGVGSGLPIYKSAGIPVIGNVAQSPVADEDTSGTYFAVGPADAVYAVGPMQSFKEQGDTKVTFAFDDVPANHQQADAFWVPLAKKLGEDFTAIYYDPTSPNFSIVGASIQASNPSVAGANTFTTAAQCIQFIQAVRQAGYNGTILAATCDAFVSALGAQAKNIEMWANNWLPPMYKYAPPEIQKELNETTAALAGVPAADIGFYTYETFATVMDVTNIIKGITGPVDSASIKAAIEATRNFQSWLGPKISCHANVWPGSSACSDELLISSGQGDGTLKPVGGGFITVSPSFLPSP
jgi:branched-chain amino acid transport system substrate-binding protein